MRRSAIRFSPRFRTFFYAAFGLLFATGVLWEIFHQYVKVQSDFGPASHPLEKWWLRLHGGSAMVVLVLLGMLLPIHVRIAWHSGRNRLSACTLAALCLLLIVTGYGLYYLGGEKARSLASISHLVLGLGLPLIIVWHVLAGKSSRK